MGKITFAEIKKNAWAYFFILPSVALFCIFYLYPFLDSFKMSFFNYKLINADFIGLNNYVGLLKNEEFLKSLFNTVCFVLFIVPSTLIFSLFVSALIIDKSEFTRSFARGAFYIPAVVSFVALSIVWGWILNPVDGLAQFLIQKVGMPPVDILGNRWYAIIALSFIVFTTAIGQPIVVYTAALGGIPQSLVEAASIDGATGLQRFFSITLPLLRPTTLFLTMICTINTFQTFVVVQLLTAGGPNGGTSTILFQLYRTAFEYNDFGRACTIGIILFAIILIISLVQYKFLSSDIEY